MLVFFMSSDPRGWPSTPGMVRSGQAKTNIVWDGTRSFVFPSGSRLGGRSDMSMGGGEGEPYYITCSERGESEREDHTAQQPGSGLNE